MLADRVNAALRPLPKGAVYALGLVPLAILVWQAFGGGLGADPVKTLERALGLHALQFLVATLCVTPLRRLAGVNLIRHRRALGVLAFVYAALHVAVWTALDLQFRWAEIGADLVKRPYIIVGFIAFLVLVPLALTSNDASVRRLGAALWRRLHWLTYPAAALAALHFVWLSKTWQAEPMVYFGAVVALLAWRVADRRRQRPAAG
jgi:sulfoxide reductase heme-binding subunit YedZ